MLPDTSIGAEADSVILQTASFAGNDFTTAGTLASKVIKPEQSGSSYSSTMDTQAKRALYDNLGQDELLTTKIDTAIRYTKKADWTGDRFKEREIANAIREEINGYDVDIKQVMELAKAQQDYH